MFNVKKTDPKELLSWILSCQQYDSLYEDGIISDKGLRVEPVPEVKELKLNWKPSGLAKPNSWRNKSIFFFSNLFK